MKLKIFVEDDKRRKGKVKPKQTGKKPTPKKSKQKAKPAKTDAEKSAARRKWWAIRKAMEKKNANAPTPPAGGDE